MRPHCAHIPALRGSIVPISGTLKSSFPFVQKTWPANLLTLKTFLLSVVALGAYIVWRVIRKERAGMLVPAFFIACTALYLYNALFVANTGAWYGTLPFFSFALALGLTLRDAAHRYAPLSRLNEAWAQCAVALVAGGLILAGHASLPDSDSVIAPHIRAASYFAHIVKPGEAAGELKDGIFAFYATSTPVFNLTGLANNGEYADALRSGELQSYLNRKHIAYIIGGNLGSGVQVPGAKEDFSGCSHPVFDNGAVAIFRVADCFAAGSPE